MSLSTLAEQPLLGCLDVETVARLLLCLPVDARLRAREVSRGWRALLNEPRFWTVLDFSPGSGVVAGMSRALLFAADERGRGHLHTLDLTGTGYVFAENLVQFVAAHGQSLRAVTAEKFSLSADQVTRLCRSAPLCTLRCCVYCTAAEALPLLRCEAPCALLQIFKLGVGGFDNSQQAIMDIAAALPSYRGKIKVFSVRNTPLQTGAVSHALMRGIAEAGVSRVTFDGCNLTPASLPDITRLLEAGFLERLVIDNYEEALFEEGPDLNAFCDVLRSSRLQKLKLIYCELWQDPAATGELLASLVGHPTMIKLSLVDAVHAGRTDDARRAAGEQLAPLITHTSSLQTLDLLDLGEAGLAPIFEALPRSSTLQGLHFSYERISREFARDVILPAVRANTSLRELSFRSDRKLPEELLEAIAIVAARTQPDGGAIAAAT